MVKYIKKFKDIEIGDVIRVDSAIFPLKRGKILEIYESGNDVRCVVKLSKGMMLDIHYNHIMVNKNKCKCDISALMISGCQCGGV